MGHPLQKWLSGVAHRSKWEKNIFKQNTKKAFIKKKLKIGDWEASKDFRPIPGRSRGLRSGRITIYLRTHRSI